MRSSRRVNSSDLDRNGLFCMVGTLLCILDFAGCGHRDQSNPVAPPAAQAVEPAESLEEIRDHLAGLIRVENDRHIIASPDEFNLWRVKALVQLDEVRRRKGVAGFRQRPVQRARDQHGVVDVASHQIAWRALTCWNPPCLGKGKGGGPLIFTRPYQHASIGSDGKLQWRTLSDQETLSPATCPQCGRMEFVQPYDEPEVEQRREQLAKELDESRRVRTAAEAAGKLVPAGVRTPTEIMKDSAELPKLYLTPDP